MPKPSINYENWIGYKVRKPSGKPFQSGSKSNTVKGIVQHFKFAEPAFSFVEDDSMVLCRQVTLSFGE